MNELIRKGTCNHCGKCCLSVKLGGLMLENPCIDLGEDRCKFYVDELNAEQYGHCLIFAGGLENIEKARDRDGKPITGEQLRWFNENCVGYPTVKDAGAGHVLLAGCGFTFEVASG